MEGEDMTLGELQRRLASLGLASLGVRTNSRLQTAHVEVYVDHGSGQSFRGHGTLCEAIHRALVAAEAWKAGQA